MLNLLSFYVFSLMLNLLSFYVFSLMLNLLSFYGLYFKHFMCIIVLLWVLVYLFVVLHNLNSRYKCILCLKILKNVSKYKI